jgi:DNA-directed RNA polymerase specialized sigma24 family protein
MTILNDFITNNYDELIKIAKKITKNSDEAEEVAHFCITLLMDANNIEEIIHREEGLKFFSGIVWRNWNSKNSPYFKLYRQNRKIVLAENYSKLYENAIDEEYTDDSELIEQIEKILNEKTNDIKLHYQLTLLKMYVEKPNYSHISRQTGIARSSITEAINNGRHYIITKLNKNKNDDYYDE